MAEPTIPKPKTTRPALRASLLGLIALAGSSALAQAPSGRSFNPITNYTANTLLRKASEQAKQGQWAEALDLYQKVIALPGEANAKLPKDDPMADPSGQSDLVVDARRHAQALIAALPPEGLALYRSRVDAQAETLFRQGATNHDRAALRRVVDELFASSWSDDAMDVLGDMAFQDGQFGVALGLYRRILPDRGAAPNSMTYPDSGLDLARVAAKKLLCRAALGIDPPTSADIDAFNAEYPEAKGTLAGRDGGLGRSVAQAIASDHLAVPLQGDGRWPTFAGSASRSRIAPGPVDIGQFQWRRKLDPPRAPRPVPQMTRFGGGFQPPTALPSAPDSGLAFHPIILGDQVVICDESKIQSFHLNARDPGDDPNPAANTGVLAWNQPLRSPFETGPARTGPGGTPRFTLTAQGDRIYARLGGPVASTIVAVRNNRDVEGKRLWEKASLDINLPRARPDAPGRISGAVFEGTPVADAQNVYVGLTEAVNTEINLYVAALDGETGVVRWIKSLGSASSPDNVMMMMNGMGGMGGVTPTNNAGNRLLSLDGQTVYYQTNLGALAALDAETGAVQWLASYPTRDGNGLRPTREANPAVVHAGLVIVAPDDAQSIFAFDASTGKMVWKTAPMDSPTNRIAHLLGVAKGRLIATGDRVYSFDVKTGKMLSFWPDGPTGFEGYGRGLLAGDSIYWPTKTEIYVLSQETGTPGDREPIRLQEHYQTGGGNLAAGDGYLVIAQRDSLVVFAQNSRLINRFREEIANAPGAAPAYFGLARVAEATGDDELALANFQKAIELASPRDMIDDQPLAEEARAKEYKLLVRLAARSASAKDFASEARRFEAAARAARNDRDRLSARLHLASAQTRAADPGAAVATLQAVLDDPRLRAQTVTYDDRWTVRADLWIADKLHSMIEENGEALYAPYDRKAEELLARGRAEKSARLLQEVGRAYPAARVVPDALLSLAQLQEDQKDFASATRVYKKLTTLPATDIQHGKALLGLARTYESQGLILAAREAMARAQGRYPDLRLDDPGAPTVGSIVTEALARPPFAALGAFRSEPTLPVPLRRVWARSFPAMVRPMNAVGTPPNPASPGVFLVDRLSVRPVDPATGDSAWTHDMPSMPDWVGYAGDHLVLASATQVVSLDPASGAVRWRYPEGEPREARAVANPFAAPAHANRTVEPPPGRLHGFRAVGGRVFCLRGDLELLALDAELGGVEWTFRPASGAINANVLIGPRRIVAQVNEPESLVVLETETGRRREFAKLADADGPVPDRAARGWERPPLPVDEDHAAVAIDPCTVALLDLNTGQRTWVARAASTTLPRSASPRIMGDGAHLLVLFEGNELTRLDASTGRQVWTRALGLDELIEVPEALAMDSERFYCATGSTLAAYRLKDGEPAWTRPLTGHKAGWSVVLAERYVTAYPSPTRAHDGDLDGVSLVVCRRDTGALVQRLPFPSTVSDLAVRLLPEGAIVATQAGAWALGEIQRVDSPRPPR